MVQRTAVNLFNYYASYIGGHSGKTVLWTDHWREVYEAQVLADNEEARRVNDKELQAMTAWKLGDPKHKSRRQLERDGMYLQFTIDIRVDFTDKDKLAVLRDAVAKTGRDLYATAALLGDNGSEPQIAVYSNDSFHGHEDISILENTVQKGRDQLVAAGTETEDEGISAEMLDAVAGVKFDKSK